MGRGVSLEPPECKVNSWGTSKHNMYLSRESDLVRRPCTVPRSLPKQNRPDTDPRAFPKKRGFGFLGFRVFRRVKGYAASITGP